MRQKNIFFHHMDLNLEYASQTRTTDDGYTVTVYYHKGEQPLPDPKTTTFQEYALWTKTHRCSRRFLLIKKKGPGDTYYGVGTERISRCGRRIYPSTRYDHWLLWRDDKISGNAITGGVLDDEITDLLLADRRLEALCSEQDNERYANRFLLRKALGCRSILKKTLTGRITNRHDLIKAYMKAAWKMTPTRYDVVERFIDAPGCNVPLADVFDFTTDADAAMQRLVEGSREERNLLQDLLGDAVVLDRRINPKWSLKRMTEEHKANIKAILEQELDAESDESIYRNDMRGRQDGYAFEAIDSPRRALLESKTMSNCVFYNYWKPASQGQYLLFHMSGHDEEVTVGFDVRHNPGGKASIEFNQIHTVHNGAASESAKNAALAFVANHYDDIIRNVTNLANPGETADTDNEPPY